VTIELKPLCTIRAEMQAPFDIGKTPAGARYIYEASAARIDGERLSGTMVGKANADWVVIGPGGVGTIDVRSLMETDDGALVFVQYLGRVDLKTAEQTIYIAPRFETSDERYRWLNTVQAVGKGRHVDGVLTYEICEVV
jgi:hypothetical protein